MSKFWCTVRTRLSSKACRKADLALPASVLHAASSVLRAGAVPRHKSIHPARHGPKSITPATRGSPEELSPKRSHQAAPEPFKSTMAEDYQEALHEVNSMLQGFDDLDAPSRRLDVLRTPGPADAFPAAALDSPPRPPPSAVAAAQAPATEDTICLLYTSPSPRDS